MKKYMWEDEGSVDFRLKNLRAADRERVAVAATRYAEIADTLRSAVGRLEKVVAAGSEGMVGQSVDAIREDAQGARDKLAKAAVRYEDAAREIAIYLPELDAVTEEVRRAEAEAEEARSSAAAAAGLPQGVPDDEGVLSDEERAKDEERLARTTQAQDAAAGARARLEGALGRLDAAGRRLGDNVNAQRYDDGLSDTVKDKFLAALNIIAKVLTAIGMVLALLCIVFPGVAALVLAAVGVAVASLVATSILYAEGKEGLVDLVLAIVGVLTFGIGSAISLGGKVLAVAGRTFDGMSDLLRGAMTGFRGMGRAAGPGGIELRTMGGVADDAGRAWRNQSDWFNNRWVNDLLGKVNPLLKPEVGLWQSSKEQWQAAIDMWKAFPGAKSDTLWKWLGTTGGWSGYTARIQSLAGLQTFASPLWAVWGGFSVLSGVFGIVWGGGRMPEENGIPAFDEKVMPW